MAGVQESHLEQERPFGRLGEQAANQLFRRVQSPLTRGFGFDTGPRYQERLASAEGPLADVIRNVQQFVPGAQQGIQDTATSIATRAPGLFNAVQSQVNNFLSQLPGFQSAIRGDIGAGQAGVAEAQGSTREAIEAARGRLGAATGPGRSSALFQQIAEDVLRPIQAQAAARGFAGQGGAQATEEDTLRQLGLEFALSQQQEIGQAAESLGGLANVLAQQGLAGAGLGLEGTNLLAQLGQAGIGAAGVPFEALPQLAQLQALEQTLPLSFASDLLGLLQGGAQGQLSLAQLAGPQVGPQSKGFNII
jgi:hypothetical protein